MASAKASSSSAPPKVKSTKKESSNSKPSSKSKSGGKKEKPQAISAEEVPSDIDSDNLDDDVPMIATNDDNDDGSSSSGSSSSSEVDSDENLEGITPRKSTKQANQSTAEKRGKSLRKYEPPIGMSELKVSSAFTSSPFEWEALANKPGVELWAIRVPKDLKPSRLSSLQLSIPKSSHGKIKGSLKTKSTTYELSTVGTNIHTHTIVNEEGRQPTAGPGAIDSMRMDLDANTNGDDVPREMKVEGGEEMDGLRLLVPKVKEGGKLFVASKPITRKLILTPSIHPTSSENENIEDPALPSFLSTTTSSKITQATEPPAKREQPSHLLKFRNKAFGFETPGPSSKVHKMEVDGEVEDEGFNDNVDGSTHPLKNSQEATEKKSKDKKEKEKEKKRKSDNKDSPKKKSKKSKD